MIRHTSPIKIQIITSFYKERKNLRDEQQILLAAMQIFLYFIRI